MRNEAEKKRIIQALDELGLNVAKMAITGIEDLGDNKWGSCQYAGAYAAYLLLHKVHNVKVSLKRVGIEMTTPTVNRPDDALHVWKKLMIDYENDSGGSSIDLAEIHRKIMKVKDFDQAFTLMRHPLSMSLWSAANMAFKSVYPDAEISMPESQGFGPKYNVMMQQNNNITGLQCYMLRKYGYVKKEKSFEDFDT